MKKISLILGPLLSLLTFFLLKENSFSFNSSVTAGVAVCCIIWWVFESIPIPVTSLLPIALFPVLDILSVKQVSEAYGNSLVLLLLGGFLLSTAMSHSGAHKRIALGMVNLFGGNNPRRVVFGFISASAFLSMWISNTATTLMLLPVAIAVLDSTSYKKMAAPLFLGIAYAASVGGIGTPVGTPPNLIFMQVYEETTGKSISFIEWMSYAMPVVLIFTPLIALWLCRDLNDDAIIKIPAIGQWQAHEVRVLIVFACTVVLWITRQEPFGGWSGLFNLKGANDASVALIAVIVLFIIPNGKGEKLLNWESAKEIPWGALLLFSGGICLADAFMESGLSTDLGKLLSGISVLPIFFMICTISLLVTFISEATSNTALTSLLMPLLASAALGMNIDPMILMLPAVMSASCAFMLPVGTAPNTVVFGTGYITSERMAREGFVFNVVGAIIISVTCYLLLV